MIIWWFDWKSHIAADNINKKFGEKTVNPLKINLKQDMPLGVQVIPVSTTWKDIGVSSCKVVLHLLSFKET